MAWGLGLLVLAFFPVLSSLIAGGAMAIAGRAQRSKGPLALENGRRAANWGLTYLLATVVLMGTHFAVLATFNDRIPNTFFPLGTFVTAWAVISVIHLVACIVGAVRASSSKLVPWNGIPFFPAPQQHVPRLPHQTNTPG